MVEKKNLEDIMAFSDLKLFALSSNQELAAKVAKQIGFPLGKSTVRQFSDGEIQVNIEESIRGIHVYILQSTSSPVNDNLMEILIMVDALKRASAESVNVVIPYYGYARQDRKARAREPITSNKGWAATGCVACQSEGVTRLPILCAVRQGVSSGCAVARLSGLSIQRRLTGRRRPDVRGHRSVWADEVVA